MVDWSPHFGGKWTEDKLAILERYLDAYTTALKEQVFDLMYIHAFAGTGTIEQTSHDDHENGRRFIEGSAERAGRITDKPFDKLIFVDRDTERCHKLEVLRQRHPDRCIEIENADANSFLQSLNEDWRQWRGVLFLDPFATAVEWKTIKKIASFEALDTWILFPTQALARMLPTSRTPDDINGEWVNRLTKVYGDESWRELYSESSQGELFDDPGMERNPGVEGLISIYKKNLENLLGDRFLPKSRTLKNSKNSALFEFMFCVGHPRGIEPAKRIANHLLRNI